jgi:hypothetical protein
LLIQCLAVHGEFLLLSFTRNADFCRRNFLHFSIINYAYAEFSFPL